MNEYIPSVKVHVSPLPYWIDKRVVDQAFLMHVEVTERSGFEKHIDRLELKTLVASAWGNLGFILFLSMWNLGSV